jgi:uncharacterized protein (TIGR03083 family)
VEISEHIDALEEQGQLLASAAEPIQLDLLVPTCPEWTLRDLLTHIGDVHRWAASYVSTGRDTMMTDQDEQTFFGGDRPMDAELLEWYREGHRALVSALRSAPEDLQCWSFMQAPSPLAFWARRQAHETTMHRVDVESIGAALTPIDAPLSADGIAEMVFGFATRGRKLLHDPPLALAIEASDTGDRWLLKRGAEHVTAASGPGPADCTVQGSASELYLALWNRLPVGPLRTAGDPNVFAGFRETLRIRWS